MAEAREHLRVDVTDEDAFIEALIVAARQHVENISARRLITQTWVWTVDALGGELVIPVSPVQSVAAVTYADADGVTQTLDADLYQVDATGTKARIRPAFGQSWPDQQAGIGGATLTLVVGYGNAAAVPATIKHAMRLMIGHWYESRQAVGPSSMPVPMGIDALITPERAWWL